MVLPALSLTYGVNPFTEPFHGLSIPEIAPATRQVSNAKGAVAHLMTNKNHWYDGQFYDRFIAPHQDAAFAHLRRMVPAGSTVLDVGCGTGRLAAQLTDRCESIDAIDLSVRNINVAQRNLQKGAKGNIRFHHTDVLQFLEEDRRQFDIATMSYVIHEIEESQRTRILQALSVGARRIILVDYLVPQPPGFGKWLNTAVEFAAGSDHYRNFRSFVKANGLRGLAERAGLEVQAEQKDDPPSTHILQVARASTKAIE
jgi:SAM-dependent methyltransferase